MEPVTAIRGSMEILDGAQPKYVSSAIRTSCPYAVVSWDMMYMTFCPTRGPPSVLLSNLADPLPLPSPLVRGHVLWTVPERLKWGCIFPRELISGNQWKWTWNQTNGRGDCLSVWKGEWCCSTTKRLKTLHGDVLVTYRSGVVVPRTSEDSPRRGTLNSWALISLQSAIEECLQTQPYDLLL